MKRKRFTEEQIIAVLKEHEAGAATADLCRKHGIIAATARANAANIGINFPPGAISDSW